MEPGNDQYIRIRDDYLYVYLSGRTVCHDNDYECHD